VDGNVNFVKSVIEMNIIVKILYVIVKKIDLKINYILNQHKDE
jgi:hypothetical protein